MTIESFRMPDSVSNHKDWRVFTRADGASELISENTAPLHETSSWFVVPGRAWWLKRFIFNDRSVATFQHPLMDRQLPMTERIGTVAEVSVGPP
jgi:hypothetical protein